MKLPLVTESVLPVILPVIVRLPLSVVLLAAKLPNVALCELIAAEVTFPATLKLPPSDSTIGNRKGIACYITRNSKITIQAGIIRS
jgi:hypothetical protein